MTIAQGNFQWTCQPQAEQFILNLIDRAQKLNPWIAEFEKSLLKHTSTRLLDWIDHVGVGFTAEIENELLDAGFIAEQATASFRVFNHPGAQLPRVILKDQAINMIDVAVSVDSISDFLMVNHLTAPIEGAPLSVFRRSCVSIENDAALWAVERRGSLTMEIVATAANHADTYLLAKEKWKTRPRALNDEDQAMEITLSIAQDIIHMLGEDPAASLILECEREYWQARNTAGQLQKNRQDRLGLGWANHDHHTFRSSRRHFHHLVRLFEMLGFHCRERYYAGQEAGWGAQIMENPRAKLVLFLDVDLAPEEVCVDFAHHPIPELEHLGTIGLWCALHGDSILKAGMHHLEAQFMFEDLKEDLSHLGIRMMDPFSSFPFLKQAFTAGEVWHVDPQRIEHLLVQNKLSDTQAESFRHHGAIGSHLENLQRREGYKGFNQKNVSVIIKKTDPRHQ
ncbi:MAG: hypothetical protein BGO14_06985 [Chlamydiales bacterium 38-26]|nr:hypothetical protein [Chlamydiales bacterium]OJV08618.1 MAG: hypothetical protein BGO14_06985 [Chlamydiales bacterium 38-26]